MTSDLQPYSTHNGRGMKNSTTGVQKFAANLSGKLLLVTTVILLLLNLYYTPLTSLCQNQHEEILQELKSINTCPEFDEIFTELESLKSSPKEDKILGEIQSLSQCEHLQDMAIEINKLKSCENEDKIFEALQQLNSSASNKEYLDALNSLKASLKQEEILKELKVLEAVPSTGNIIATLEALKTDLRNHAAMIEANASLHKRQEDEEKRILNELDTEARNEFKVIKENLKKLDSIKSILLNSNASPKDKIELPEFRSVVNGRDDKKDAIFLIETTGNDSISARHVCAVESIAKLYPKADIYLLFAYMSNTLLKVATNEALNMVLKHYRNVHATYVDLDQFFKDTPLDNFNKAGKLNTDKFKQAHSSEILRFVPLYLYGGRYFDLNLIAMKEITEKNFVFESPAPDKFGNLIFGFEKKSPVAETIFQIINAKNSNFEGTEWEYTDSGKLLVEGLKKYTGVATVGEMKKENMKGFVKLGYSLLKPVSDAENGLYFEEANSNATMIKFKGMTDILVHYIGPVVREVKLGSQQPYGLLAQKQCPRAYWSCKTDFN